MAVYIKGMEMPTDCHNCPLGFGGGCYCGTSADEYMCPDHGRSEWCPLVLVPPHGRLIDADAYKQEMKDCRMAFWDEVLDSMPTVIPAEEGET